MSFWYLATPYSKYRDGLTAAHRMACEQAALLLAHGVPVYSPIAHTHPIALAGGMDPLDHGIWLPADAPFMAAACGLIVCRLDGWQDSYGIAEEIKYFAARNKPLVYMDPGWVPALPAIPEPAPPQTASDICALASSLTGGDRARTHGDKVENHRNIAALWNAYLGWRLDEGCALKPADVALMMVLLKVARTKSGAFNIDDYVDLAGYGGVAGEIATQARKTGAQL